MTIAVDHPTPWTNADLDPDEVLADLSLYFPGISMWWGEWTASWWAVVRGSAGNDQLIEGSTPDELMIRISAALRNQRQRLRAGSPAPVPNPVLATAAPMPPRRHKLPRRGLWQHIRSWL